MSNPSLRKRKENRWDRSNYRKIAENFPELMKEITH